MPRHDADRNLLFGILALQMELITRDALIAAMGAWALAKHRPIGEILVEAGALDPTDRADLEPMIDRRIARQGGDPARSLAALSSVGSVADQIRRSVADPDILASIAQIPTDFQTDPFATRAPDPADPHFTIPPEQSLSGVRFHKVRKHAAGNLGVVYVARDEELNRHVALKEIKERNADEPYNQAKFLLEAEVTGGLEHPGIVPVYGLGHHLDGRPFYAMRFIRGKSLLEAIKRFHTDESLKSDPGRRSLELQRLLRRFTDVCNAIAYAHSRGVLHRDLKPDNVMVGKYGETLVVDWGLAKALGRSGEAETTENLDDPLPEGSLQPSSTDGMDATQAGSLVGTPAYMSPEQAAGRLDLLGPASDIYGLGATLYHLLVGRPSIEAKSIGELLAKIQAGEITRPRTLAPWLDAALEAVCLKAMNLRPEDRYTSPRLLADDIERWLADEPVTAYREPFTRRARRWTRRHKTAVTTAATTSLAACLILFGARSIFQAQKLRTQEAAREALALANRRAIEAEATSDLAKWGEAAAAAENARQILESIGGGDRDLRIKVRATLDELLTRQRDRKLINDLEDAQLLGMGVDVEFNRFDRQPASEAYFRALKDYGIDLASQTPTKVSSLVRNSRVSNQIAGVFLELRITPPKDVPASQMLEISKASFTEPKFEEMRLAFSKNDFATLRRLLVEIESRKDLKNQIHLISSVLSEADDLTANLPVLEKLREENPDDFWFNEDLAVAYSKLKPPRNLESVRFHTAAISLRPDSPGTYLNLGHALGRIGDIDGEIKACRRALQLRPDYAEASVALGLSLAQRDRDEEAEKVLREVIRRQPGHGFAHTGLGLLLVKQFDLGKSTLAEAERECREGTRLRPDSSLSHSNLALVLKNKGDLAGAEIAARESIRLDSGNEDAYFNLGSVLREKKDFVGAIASLHAAIRIEPESPHYYVQLYATLSDQGDRPGAEALLNEVSRLKVDPFEFRYQLGSFLLTKGQHKSAANFYREALNIRPDDFKSSLGLAYALLYLGDSNNAIASFRDSIRLNPNSYESHYNLGYLLQRRRDFDAAITAFRDAARLKPSDPAAVLAISYTLRDKGDLDGAINSFRESVRIKPDDPVPHVEIGLILMNQKKDYDGAMVEFRESIRIKPDHDMAYNNVGACFLLKRDYKSAIEPCREAIRLQPSNALAYANLAAALTATGDAAGGAAALRQSIRLNLMPKRPAAQPVPGAVPAAK